MPTIRLAIKGLGHVPSMKNSKMWTGKKLITKPERQVWMERAIRSIESQLRSMYRTTSKGTQTELSLPSWTVSSVPLDDSVDWIDELTVRVVRVPAGQEGAEITLEQIT